MIAWKRIYAAIAVIVFIALITSFFVIMHSKCSSYKCVRFCNSDRTEISDDELMAKFFESKIHDKDYNYDHTDYHNFTMIREYLKCKNPETYKSNHLRPVSGNFIQNA